MSLLYDDFDTLVPSSNGGAGLVGVGSGRSDVGRVRANNEDAYIVDQALGLYAVADGMGGRPAGELASAIAVRAAGDLVAERQRVLEAVADGTSRPQALAEVVRDAVQAANRAVYRRSARDLTLQGMGSTLTILVLAGEWAGMGHVGDSRLHRCRRGRVEQLSVDHNYAAELVRLGVLSPSEVVGHPLGHALVRYVGATPYVHAEVRFFDVAPSDRYVLCTDGLSAYLPDPCSLEQVLLDRMLAPDRDASIDEVVDRLVERALAAGGRDNVTVVVADMLCRSEPRDRELSRSGVRTVAGR